jgi:hypothetical protein
MHGKNNPVSSVALHLGDAPGVLGGSHEIVSDGDSVPELGVEVKVTTELEP